MNCAHHWIIEPPNGPTSGGTCQKCGEHRAFHNGSDDKYRFGEFAVAHRGQGVVPEEHQWPKRLGYSNGIAR